MKVAATISPGVGIFHNAFPPGTPPFVNEGDIVAAESIVGVILGSAWPFEEEGEENKTEDGTEYHNGLIVNRISAQVAARIIAGLAQDGATVEYGQPLFAICPKNPFGRWTALDWPD